MEACRAFLYEYLSLAFSYPEDDLLQALEDGLGDLEHSLRALEISYDTTSLRAVLKGARERPLEVQAEHNALFATSVKVPARETAYELDKTARSVAELADIEGFYRAFGLKLTGPIEPDSLVAELEFCSVLLKKQRYALNERNQEGVEICRDGYRSFLTDHLGRWWEVFVHDLEGATEEEYYRSLGTLLGTFLARQTRELGGEVRRLSYPTPEALRESTRGCDPGARGGEDHPISKSSRS